MTTQISTFNFKSNLVRIELFQNEPYFCLSDVCVALDISNANSSRFRLNENGIHKMYTLTNGGKQELTFINEPNLYRIIFRSNKSEAVEFQNWVFEEVLPQIRKTGSYSQNSQQNLPLVKPRPEVTITLPLDELRNIAWAVYSAKRQNGLINDLRQPLSAIGSRFAIEADDYGREYKRCWEMAFPAIQSIFKQINADQYTDEISWQRIVHHFNPAQKQLRVRRYTSLVDI